MKRVVTIALVVLLFAGVGVLLLSGTQETPAPRVSPPEPTAAPVNAKPVEAVPGQVSEPATISAARQRVTNAELALQTAVAQRKAAEADINIAEREVEELERWVAEIEARGEDPVDYADEGLEKLQPAFFAYQDAAERLELAEAMEITATEELALANAALSAVLSSTGTEN